MPSEPSPPVTSNRESARRVRVSLGAESGEVLVSRLDWIAELGCSVELRLDLLPEQIDLARLQRRYAELDFVAAWPMLPEAGGLPPTDQARVAALREAAEAGLPWVDVPAELANADLPVGRRIWSWHGTDANLAVARDAEAALSHRAGADDVIKLVTHAETSEDALGVLAISDNAQPGSRIAFARGAGGEATRLLAPRCGAPWTYAAWRGEATAPGQRGVEAMLDELPTEHGPLYGVVGDPIAHSWSPPLWAAALRGADAPGGFLRFRAQDFDRFLSAAAGLGVEALAVTAPFKEAAAQAAESADQTTTAAGAANLLIRRGSNWHAANTDGHGALEALAEGGFRDGGELLILGAGGAARATVVEALAREAQVRVAARHPERARAVLPSSPQLSVETLDTEAGNYAADAIVQATPVGSAAQPGQLLGTHGWQPGTVLLDMVYAPLRTEFLRRGQAAGGRTVTGSRMLLHQMLRQWQLVRGAALSADAAQAVDDSLRACERAHEGVVLVGPRCAGKSALGAWLASALGVEFLDADAVYERAMNEPVAEAILADPVGFREKEAYLLSKLIPRARDEGAVLATGGGAVESPTTCGLLADAFTFWLHADAEILERRQLSAPRPRIRPGSLREEIDALLAEREAGYRSSSVAQVWTGGGLEEAKAALRTAFLGRNSAVSSCYR